MKRRRLVRRIVAVSLLLAGVALAIERQPNADYRARRQALAAKTDGGVVLIFSDTEASGGNAIYGFRQNDNFYYLTGLSDPGGALLIAPATEAKEEAPAHPYTEILFLPAHNSSQEKWTGPKLGAGDTNAVEVTGVDHVEPLDEMHDALVHYAPGPRVTIYADLGGYGEESNASSSLDWLRRANAFPAGTSFKDVKPLLASLRTVKDAGEVELIRKAVNASMAAHMAAMKAMHPGITEREISALMQYEFGKRGCERPAYAPIVGTGANSTLLHYSADSATVAAGDIVVLDVAGEYSMYASDITRTLPATGKFSARQREIYDIVLSAQRAAMAAFQSGKSHMLREDSDSLYQVAYEYINTHGKDLHGQPLGKYFIHGLGHYVGLNVHDAGDYKVPLGPGMIFTIEPGIYIPEEKLGVRIEDMFYVDRDGKLVKLTAALPSTADEVERAMAAK
jgi:Xaa-Pro aminopeptidase